MSVKIRIANREPFQCPLGLTAAEATRQIRAKYNLRHGGIYRNGAGIMLPQIISEGGTYEFVHFRENCNSKRSSSPTLKDLDAFLNMYLNIFSSKGQPQRKR
jgi:hypothetical protein